MPPQSQPQLIEVALACARRGDFTGVAETCRSILAVDPQQPDALHCMGLLHRRTGQIAAAVDCHERSVRGRPGNAEYRNALGLAYRAANRVADAIDTYETAIRLDPSFIDAYVNVGQVHFSRGEFRNAVARFRDAVERRPAEPLLHIALGRGLAAQGDRRGAEASFRRALMLNPAAGAAYAGLGDLQLAKGDTRAALAAFKDGIANDPIDAGNYLRMAPVLQNLDQTEAAIGILQEGVKRVPGAATLHVALARMLMRQEKWPEAWQHYERRMLVPPLLHDRHRFVQPLWDGSELRGQRLCVHFESGLAESLALLRYLEPLLDAGVELVLRCPALMRKMLEPLSAHMAVCGPDDPLPPFDRQVWLASLPRLLNRPDPAIVAPAPRGFDALANSPRWRERFEDLPRPLVGLHWRSPTGSRVFADMRALPAAFATFAGALIALQDRTVAEEIAAAGLLEQVVHVGAEVPNEGDIATELACAAAQCDLVVTVDSPIAPVAAMLKRPTLMLIDGSEEFPWPLDRVATAWFPNLAVLRRSSSEDDLSYITKIQQAVEALIGPDEVAA